MSLPLSQVILIEKYHQLIFSILILYISQHISFYAKWNQYSKTADLKTFIAYFSSPTEAKQILSTDFDY